MSVAPPFALAALPCNAPGLSGPLGLIGPLGFSELILIGGVALLIFGGRLPEVAMRAAAQVMRARRVVMRMWREAGLEQELRRVQWEIERKMPRDADYDLGRPLVRTSNTPTSGASTPAVSPAVSTTPPDAGRVLEDDEHGAEAAGEAARRDPVIGLGAPPGTVSVTQSFAREPDPAPRSPDLPPRDTPTTPPREGVGPTSTGTDGALPRPSAD